MDVRTMEWMSLATEGSDGRYAMFADSTPTPLCTCGNWPKAPCTDACYNAPFTMPRLSSVLVTLPRPAAVLQDVAAPQAEDHALTCECAICGPLVRQRPRHIYGPGYKHRTFDPVWRIERPRDRLRSRRCVLIIEDELPW